MKLELKTTDLIRVSVTLSSKGIVEHQRRIHCIDSDGTFTSKVYEFISEKALLVVEEGNKANDPQIIEYYTFTQEDTLKLAQQLIYDVLSERYRFIQLNASQLREGFEKHGFNCDQCGRDTFGNRFDVTDENFNVQPGINICNECFAANIDVDPEEMSEYYKKNGLFPGSGVGIKKPN